MLVVDTGSALDIVKKFAALFDIEFTERESDDVFLLLGVVLIYNTIKVEYVTISGICTTVNNCYYY